MGSSRDQWVYLFIDFTHGKYNRSNGFTELKVFGCLIQNDITLEVYKVSTEGLCFVM